MKLACLNSCNIDVSFDGLQPHSPDNRALARECKDVKIDRVYIGSCTGGKTEDFLAAARVFLASVRFHLSFTILPSFIFMGPNKSHINVCPIMSYKHITCRVKRSKYPHSLFLLHKRFEMFGDIFSNFTNGDIIC